MFALYRDADEVRALESLKVGACSGGTHLRNQRKLGAGAGMPIDEAIKNSSPRSFANSGCNFCHPASLNVSHMHDVIVDELWMSVNVETSA